MTDLMAERYGRGHRRRWPLVVVGVIVVAALAWVVWAVWEQSTPKVTSSLRSSDIGEHSTTVTLRVSLSGTDVHPTCLVRAYAADHSAVGDISFTVADPPSKSFSVTRTIRTERRATAVESIGCTASGQNQPR